MAKKYSVSRCDTPEEGDCEEWELEDFDTLEEAQAFIQKCIEGSYPVVDVWAAELYLYEDGKHIDTIPLY